MQFDFGAIEVATNKFSDDNKIGEGGFGKVYKVSRIKIHFLRLLVLKISKHIKFTAYKYEKILEFEKLSKLGFYKFCEA